MEDLKIYLIKSKNQLMDYYNYLHNKDFKQYERDGYIISLEKLFAQLNNDTSEIPVKIEIGYVLHIINDSYRNESMSVEDFVYIDDMGNLKNVVSIFDDGAKITMNYRYPYNIKTENIGYSYDPTNMKSDPPFHTIRTINEHLPYDDDET